VHNPIKENIGKAHACASTVLEVSNSHGGNVETPVEDHSASRPNSRTIAHCSFIFGFIFAAKKIKCEQPQFYPCPAAPQSCFPNPQWGPKLKKQVNGGNFRNQLKIYLKGYRLQSACLFSHQYPKLGSNADVQVPSYVKALTMTTVLIKQQTTL